MRDNLLSILLCISETKINNGRSPSSRKTTVARFEETLRKSVGISDIRENTKF